MARPLRYEAAGTVFHVMARGDGGKTVLENDKDRYGWVDWLERGCGRLGRRVHAWRFGTATPKETETLS